MEIIWLQSDHLNVREGCKFINISELIIKDVACCHKVNSKKVFGTDGTPNVALKYAIRATSWSICKCISCPWIKACTRRCGHRKDLCCSSMIKNHRNIQNLIGKFVCWIRRESVCSVFYGWKEYLVTYGDPHGSVSWSLLWNIMYDEILCLQIPEESKIVLKLIFQCIDIRYSKI